MIGRSYLLTTEADLAAIAGHTLATMHARYVHPLRRSDAAVREAIG